MSWTNYHHNGVVYSGDITDATNGATEFIDMPMTTDGHYVVPQVYIYTGESFDEVAESMFGYQTRTQDQLGAPFDARTVRARSHLRGQGRVALPMVFAKGEGGWQAVWLHLYLRGAPSFNRVEGNAITTADRVRALMERRYLTVGLPCRPMARKGRGDDVGRSATGRAGHVHRHSGARGPARRVGGIYTGSAQ